MAKLTNQQIKAVANKLSYELAVIARDEEIAHKKQLEESDEFKRKLNILSEAFNAVGLPSDTKAWLLASAKSSLCLQDKKTFYRPSVSEILTDLIIKGITDEDFNMDSLIEQFKTQYNL